MQNSEDSQLGLREEHLQSKEPQYKKTDIHTSTKGKEQLLESQTIIEKHIS